MEIRPLFDRLVLVGSTARKAGKTTYVTNLLKKNIPQVLKAVKSYQQESSNKVEIIINSSFLSFSFS